MAGRADEALADAERAIAYLTASGEPNPYVFGVTVRAQVQALAALGRLDDARSSGEGALGRLGDRVPQARSLILATVAAALRDAAGSRRRTTRSRAAPSWSARRCASCPTCSWGSSAPTWRPTPRGARPSSCATRPSATG